MACFRKERRAGPPRCPPEQQELSPQGYGMGVRGRSKAKRSKSPNFASPTYLGLLLWRQDVFKGQYRQCRTVQSARHLLSSSA